MIDHEELQEIAGRLAVPEAVRRFPQGGEEAIKQVLYTCKKVFGVIDPQQLEKPILIFSRAQPDPVMERSSSQQVTNLSALKNFVSSGFALEIDPFTTNMYVWAGSPPLDIHEISTKAVVFRHHHGNEKFLIAGSETPLPRVFAGIQSIFALPSYGDLADALAYYRERVVRNSACETLKTIWYDENRLFLKAKPESKMRDSLIQYLRHTLRFDAEVMPEQNVNETEPVDIRVTFQFSRVCAH